MESKIFNELLKATKSDNADTIGKAFARAVTISKRDLSTSREYEFPELVQQLIDKAQATFKAGSKDYFTFINYYRLIKWIDSNRDFSRCQQASFQRDIMVLKAYAERFYLAELTLCNYPGEDKDSIAYTYYIEAYMNHIPTEPFSTVNDFEEGLNTNSRIDYSYSWIVAYNTVIKTAARVHELPELELELLDIDSDIQMLKEVITTLNKTITLIDSSEAEDSVKYAKIEALRNFTSFVDTHGYYLEPSAEKLTDTTAAVKDFSIFDKDYKVFTEMFDSINGVFEGEVFNE